MRNGILSLFLLFFILSCNPSKDWHEISLKNLIGEKVSLSNLDGPIVFYFLSPECPLCENYALNIREIYQSFEYYNFRFYGIFPGEYYSKEQIKEYKKVNDLGIEFLLDPKYELTNSLDATTTPEAIVFSKEQELIYQGAIDNWMISLGKKRTVVTEHYLLDALAAVKKNTVPKVVKTKPVGCYIE